MWRSELVSDAHGPWSTYDVVAGLRDAAAVVIQSNSNRIIQAAWSRAGPRMSNQYPRPQPARSVGSAHTDTAAALKHTDFARGMQGKCTASSRAVVAVRERV